MTIIDGNYGVLFSYWLTGVKSFIQEPVFVLVADEDGERWRSVCRDEAVGWIEAYDRHELSGESTHHATAKKCFLFDYLPAEVESILFLDVDALVVSPINVEGYFAKAETGRLLLVVDYYVGYKEKLEQEMQMFDPEFQMKFFDDGRYFYFNTGVFFVGRDSRVFFRRVYRDWVSYYHQTGQLPSIYDQNILNYGMIKYGQSIEELPTTMNCLRQYQYTIQWPRILLGEKQVQIIHFNGGTPDLKLERMQPFVVNVLGKG